MKQSRSASLIETCVSTASGFGLSLLAQWFFLPLLGVRIEFHQNLVFAIIMTVISIARGYTLRRVFEFFHIRTPIPPSILAIAAERRRQVDVEGWTPGHDDQHRSGDLALASACYAMATASRALKRSGRIEFSDSIDRVILLLWPWECSWWKPQDDRRDLIRSGALTAAELDKLDRERRRPRLRVNKSDRAAAKTVSA